jgi:hypothetical protein
MLFSVYYLFYLYFTDVLSQYTNSLVARVLFENVCKQLFGLVYTTPAVLPLLLVTFVQQQINFTGDYFTVLRVGPRRVLVRQFFHDRQFIFQICRIPYCFERP